jgi:hypothetical protein
LPRLTLLYSADPEALLTHAAAPFCVRGRSAAPLPLLVVRHAGVRDGVYQRAMRAGCTGWLGEPVVTFPKLGPLLAGPTAPLGPQEREVLLRRVLRTVPLTQLRPGAPGVLDALDPLFGDLWAERVTPERFAAALSRCEGDAWARGRNTDLGSLYGTYLAAVQALEPRHGIRRSEGRDGFALAAEAVAAGAPHARRALRAPFGDPDAPRTVSVLGTTDLRRGWGLLLEALRHAPFVDELRIYLLRADESDQDPLWETLRGWDGAEQALPSLARPGALCGLRDSIFRPAAATLPLSPEVRGLAAPDTAREAEEVARRVKRLLVEDGAPSERIAVVARTGGSLADSAVAALRRHGIPTSARFRHGITDAPAVAALLRVFRAAGEGWTRRALLELAGSPYWNTGLEAAPIAAAGKHARPASLDAWSELLAGEGETPEWFVDFAASAGELQAGRPLAGWIECALRCLGADGGPGLWDFAERVWSEDADGADPAAVDAARLDTAAIAESIKLLREWQRALPLDPHANAVLTAGSWHAELARVLADGSVPLRTGPRGGVEVLDALSAVGRPWDHLFLIGMQAGAFPAEPPRHALFDDAEREALWRAGLPLEPGDVWLAREASLFQALVAAPEQGLHLSYAYADGRGGPQLPSAYLDEVAERFAVDEGTEWLEQWPGSQLLPEALSDVWCTGDLSLFAVRAWRSTDSLRQQEAHSALAHLARTPGGFQALGRMLDAGSTVQARVDLRGTALETRREGARPWNGQITDPELLAYLGRRFGDTVWSVNRLEKYGFCPWSFFAEHVLKLQGWSEPDDDIDPAGRGRLLHTCLEQLHSRLRDEFGDAALDPEVCWDRVREHLDAVIPAALDEHSGWPGPASCAVLASWNCGARLSGTSAGRWSRT